MEQPHEPIRLLERQRPQQHGVDDAEDGGVGADAEREHGDDRERERRGAEQDPEGVAEIGKERAHGGLDEKNEHQVDRFHSIPSGQSLGT